MTRPSIPKIPEKRPERIAPGIPVVPEKKPDYIPEPAKILIPKKPEIVTNYASQIYQIDIPKNYIYKKNL